LNSVLVEILTIQMQEILCQWFVVFIFFICKFVAEERPLKDHECPLIVQLNWGKDDREGRFLLKKETDPTLLVHMIILFLNICTVVNL